MEHQFAYPTVRPLPPRGFETAGEPRVTALTASAVAVTSARFGQADRPTAAGVRSEIHASQTPGR
jgi:hypothetical protein